MEKQFNWQVFNSTCVVLFACLMVVPAIAYYQPETGRFLQRDPMQYVDGLNLYEYVSSSPIIHSDYSGLFGMGKRSHENLTKKAYEEAMKNSNLPPACKTTILKKLIKANTGQDSGDAFNDLKRHYNRAKDESIGGSDGAYAAYVLEESINCAGTAVTGNCQEELYAIGRLDHTLEDFYAHAVGPNGATELWSNGATYDPYNRGNTHPSSYPGEHPLVGEPGSEDEKQFRFDTAVNYMINRYKNVLLDYAKRCGCKICQ